MAKKNKKNPNDLVSNKTARRNYTIIDSFEVGIELKGTEVKSLRARKATMTDSFARVETNNQVFLYNLHISPYEQGNRFNHDPLRSRRLLLHKNEITRLKGKTDRKGMALIPLKLYLKNGKVKLELAVATGKVKFDKRDDIKKREHKRDIEREVSKMNRR
jgi:SsrA-binding protein